jgi:hypothetical protein
MPRGGVKTFMNCLYFNDFIRSVYEEIGEDAGYSYEYLAYWFAGNYNLGRLNTLIDTRYSGSYTIGDYGEMTDYVVSPEMGSEETAIYQKIFEIDFYSKQARNTLRGAAGYAGGDWISLREGDSSITRTNRNEVAKSYKSLAGDAQIELDKMVQSYLKFRATPQQVVGDDVIEATYYRGITSLYDGYRGNRESLL